MIKIVRQLLIAIALLGTTGVAMAQEVKIGYVNLDRILRDAAAAKSASQRLETEFSRKEKEIQELGSKLKAQAEKLDRDAPTLSETERNRRQRELGESDKEFQRKQREFREDFAQRRNEEMSAVIDKANRAIKQIFDSEKYDLIIQEAVFVSPRIDITDKVLKSMGNAPAK